MDVDATFQAVVNGQPPERLPVPDDVLDRLERFDDERPDPVLYATFTTAVRHHWGSSLPTNPQRARRKVTRAMGRPARGRVLQSHWETVRQAEWLVTCAGAPVEDVLALLARFGKLPDPERHLLARQALADVQPAAHEQP